jgi:hypothetical protein
VTKFPISSHSTGYLRVASMSRLRVCAHALLTRWRAHHPKTSSGTSVNMISESCYVQAAGSRYKQYLVICLLLFPVFVSYILSADKLVLTSALPRRLGGLSCRSGNLTQVTWINYFVPVRVLAPSMLLVMGWKRGAVRWRDVQNIAINSIHQLLIRCVLFQSASKPP